MYEPQTIPPRSIPVDELQHNLDQWAGKDLSPVIAAAGKSGVGMSTMINNFLKLKDNNVCPTGDDADPTTTEVKMYSNYKHRVKIKVLDIPGLSGTRKSEIVTILKRISEKTDLLFYCVSLHPTAKIERADVENIKMLTAVYGPKIWLRTILVLTFANQRSSKNEDIYKRLIEGYAKKFQQALRTAKIVSVEVKSILSGEVRIGTIPAVPIGLEPSDPLLLCENWSDVLLHEVLKRINPQP